MSLVPLAQVSPSLRSQAFIFVSYYTPRLPHGGRPGPFVIPAEAWVPRLRRSESRPLIPSPSGLGWRLADGPPGLDVIWPGA